MIGAFGFGALFFSILAIQICNPDNAKPTIIGADGTKFFDKEIAERVPTYFVWVAIIWACLGGFAVFAVRRNPEFKNDAGVT